MFLRVDWLPGINSSCILFSEKYGVCKLSPIFTVCPYYEPLFLDHSMGAIYGGGELESVFRMLQQRTKQRLPCSIPPGSI